MINELFLEVMRAKAPILLQIHSEVARNDHPPPIRHEPSLIHFPHQRVHEWHPAFPLPPAPNDLHIRLPRIILSVIDTVLTEHFIAVVHAPIPIEVTPEELINVHFCRFVRFMLMFEFLYAPVNLAAADCAVLEPWGQLRGVIRADQVVAGVVVVGHGTRCKNVLF